MKTLGDPFSDPEAAYQQHLPHDYYYAAELTDKSSYVLYSEIVAPGRHQFEVVLLLFSFNMLKNIKLLHYIFTYLSAQASCCMLTSL